MGAITIKIAEHSGFGACGVEINERYFCFWNLELNLERRVFAGINNTVSPTFVSLI